MNIIRLKITKISELYPVFTLSLSKFPPEQNHEHILKRNTNVFRQQVSNLKDDIQLR